MPNTATYEIRHENFGDRFETWAIYVTTKNGNTAFRKHVRDANTRNAALDIVDALLSEKSHGPLN